MLNHYKVKNVVHGLTYITGGGLCENIERIVPPGCRVVLHRNSWTVPPVLAGCKTWAESTTTKWTASSIAELAWRLSSAYYADKIRRLLAEHQLESWEIGSCPIRRIAPVVWG
ncbi:MAG: AIR synthase-related protein [Pirellulaceae bacterium]